MTLVSAVYAVATIVWLTALITREFEFKAIRVKIKDCRKPRR